MEEKKLTDEEIVKALECCSKSWDCNNCKCDKENNNRFICSENLLKDCLNLIHRLKSENEKLKKVIAEQNSEIERLEDEKYKVEQNLKQCENGYKLELHTARFDMRMNRERVAELQNRVEKLTEENEILKGNPPVLAGRSLGKTIRAKLLSFDRMKEQNAELQKQVDELTAFKNEAISTSLYGKGRKDGEEVAVKDTVKEIYTQVLEWLPIGEDYGVFIDNIEMWLKERYGVEVE